MAIKIVTIMKRGVKKYFWDIAELLHHYSVNDFINFYIKKYSIQQLLILVPFAMTFFIATHENGDIVSLKGQTWTSVKKYIQQHVNNFFK